MNEDTMPSVVYTTKRQREQALASARTEYRREQIRNEIQNGEHDEQWEHDERREHDEK